MRVGPFAELPSGYDVRQDVSIAHSTSKNFGVYDESGRLLAVNTSRQAAIDHVIERANDAQIKSATDNRGTFDPNDPNILHQGPRGMTQFLKTGQAVIRALQDPNESTAAHEIHHAITPMFMKLAAEGISETLTRDMSHMSRWMGFKDIGEFNSLHEKYVDSTLAGRDLKRYIDGQEKGARGFEQYLRTGKAPAPDLKAAFEQFKRWLTDIYHNIKGSPIDVQLGRKQQAVWDRMLGGTGKLAEGGTQAKQETIQTERAQRGVSPIEKEAARRWPTVWEDAKKSVDADGGQAIRAMAEELARNPRVLSDLDQAKLVYDRTSGAFSQLLAREDYTYERQVNRASITKGEALTADEKQVFKDLSEKYEQVQTELNTRNAELQSQRAYMTELQRQAVQRDKVHDWRVSVRKGRKRPAEAVDAEFANMQNQLARFAREANGLHQADEMTEDRFPPEIRKLIKDMARNRVEAGSRSAEDVNDEVHGIVRQYFPDVTPREVGEIWSDYGKSSSMSKDEIDVAMREVKHQERLLASLEDAQKGVSPARSGLTRDRASARVKELTKQVKQAMIDSGLIIDKRGLDPEKQWQTALKSFKTRTENRIADYRRRLDERDFSKAAPRQKLAYDADATHLAAQLEQVKQSFEREQYKIEKANRSGFQKGLDMAVKWRRGILLSGIQTIAKLSQAAAARNISTPLEEIAGSALGRVPGIRGVAAKAPREGGFNAQAEGAALMTLVNKALYGPEGKITKSALQTLKTGHSAFDVLYGGKKVRLDPEFVDFFAHAHGALKTQPKIAEFQRGFVKRMEFEDEQLIKQGKSSAERRAILAEPEMQMRIGMQAYADANRAILMQDNGATTIYRMITGWMHNQGTPENPSKGWRAAEAATKFVFPIVKVGTNYAIESGNYVVGSVGGLAKLIAYGGAKNLTPEQADSVMRSFKKGSLGLGLLALGWANPQHFGGYYQPGEKRDEDEPGAGQTRLFGINIPKYLAHNPMLEAVQFGATVRRVYDGLIKKGHAPVEAGLSGAVRAGVGLAEEVPFIGEPFRLAKDSESSGFLGKVIGENLKEMVVPPDVERIAKATDPGEKPGAGNVIKRFTGFAPNTVKRDASNPLRMTEAAIPWLRPMVPEKESKSGSKSAYRLRSSKGGGSAYR